MYMYMYACVIGGAGASPPSRMSGSNFHYIFRSFGLAYRNSLCASFYVLFQIFPHGRCTYALHTLERTWASQLRQSMLTQTSTAHGDPSLAAPMLTARFSYTRGYRYKLALYIVRATQAHSPACGIAPARP